MLCMTVYKFNLIELLPPGFAVEYLEEMWWIRVGECKLSVYMEESEEAPVWIYDRELCRGSGQSGRADASFGGDGRAGEA